jgi:hypothetical protein
MLVGSVSSFLPRRRRHDRAGGIVVGNIDGNDVLRDAL